MDMKALNLQKRTVAIMGSGSWAPRSGALMREKYPADTVFLGESEAPGGDPAADEELAKHADWAAQLREKYAFTAENVDDILRDEVGRVFAQVLEHAGVYKRTPEGREAFLRFLNCI